MAKTDQTTHDQLQASNALVHAIVNHAPNGIITFDEHGLIYSFNPTAEHIFAYAAAEVIGKSMALLISESGNYRQSDKSSKSDGSNHAEHHTTWLCQHMYRECRGIKKDNSTVPIELIITDMCMDKQTYFLAFVHDLSDRKKMHARLDYMASHDQVTGLINYQTLISSVNLAISKQQAFMLMYLELDRLQPINEVLGHAIGDQVLLQVGKRLRSSCDTHIQLAHISGSGFVLLWPNPAGDIQPMDVAASLHADLAAPLKLKQFMLDTEASIGIVCHPGHGAEAEDLLRCAQIAMQFARKRQVMTAIYDHDMEQYQLEHLSLASELRHAIEADELIIYYQPKVDISSRKTVAVEALVRWKHPEKGLIQPDLFIPMAEQTGIIHPFTAWLIQAASHQIKQWQDKGIQLVVAINLAPRNLLEADLADRLQQALQSHAIPAASLMVEITERGIIADPQRALATLNAIHALGIAISIDDFGTGYSSLAYLKDLPIDELKIDQSFISVMHDDATSLTIVQMVIQMAHYLGLEVTAEGVESLRDWQRLEIMHCERAQGYLMGKPMPADKLEQWLLASEWNA